MSKPTFNFDLRKYKKSEANPVLIQHVFENISLSPGCLHWKLVTTSILTPSAHIHIWYKYLT
jgi:hypothetical protein